MPYCAIPGPPPLSAGLSIRQQGAAPRAASALRLTGSHKDNNGCQLALPLYYEILTSMFSTLQWLSNNLRGKNFMEWFE